MTFIFIPRKKLNIMMSVDNNEVACLSDTSRHSQMSNFN